MSDERNNLEPEEEKTAGVETDPLSPIVEPEAEERSSETDKERKAEIERLKKASAMEMRKTYGTGTKVTAFIFFTLTTIVFAFYLFFAITILYTPLFSTTNSLAEALAEVFVYLFGLIITFAFAVLQLPENIISLILFGRLRRRSDRKAERIVFTVFFALTLVMLLITVLSLAIFLLVAGLNR